MIINPKPYIPIKDQDHTGNTVIDLRNTDFKGIHAKPGTIAVTFEFCFFENMKIQNTEVINFKEVSVMFNNCYIRNLEISDIVSENISITIHSSLLNGRISAKNLKSVHLSNCLLNHGVTLTNQKSIELAYTTENIFPFHWNKMFNKIIGPSHRRIKPTYRRIIRQKQYYQIENPQRLNVRSSRKVSDKTGLYLMDWNSVKMYKIGYRLTKVEEDSLKIHLSINYGVGAADLETNVNNVILEALALSGTPSGKMSFENIEVSNWYMSDFDPQKEAGFYNIVPRPLLIEETKIGVHKCNFDNVWFDNVEFNKFERLSFFRSKLSKANFTSCSFPDQYNRFSKFLSIPNIHYPEQKPINYHKDQYEMLLQLKKAFDATGNFYEGLKLQAISYAALQKIAVISGEDKFILRLNRWSNNHSLSIRRPIYWFLGLTIFFYILYLLSLHRLFNATPFDANLIGYYFSFLDITHRSDFLEEKDKLTGLALWIDYVNKVVTGYLIFQFISAFRKYGKNG